MRATVDAKKFTQALSQVTKAIKQSALPVMEGVLVQVKDGRCTLTATDFTTWLTTSIPADGDDLGFVFQRPKDAARACGHFEGKLSLEIEETVQGKDRCLRLTMSCGPRAAQVMAFLPEDYPAMPEQKTKYTYTVNAARLLERVEHVKYTLKKPDDKLEARRTHVQFSGDKVFALDGYRLAWDADDSLTVRQPFMALPEALGYLKFFGDQEITASMGERYLRMSNGTTTIQTRIEGPFVFDVDGAVPKKFAEEFYISPKEFLRELDYLEGFQPKQHRLTTCFCEGRLFFDGTESKCSTSVEIDGVSGLADGFDQRFMKDALNQFKEEARVRIKLSGGLGPIILEAEGRNDFAMVLPVRLHGLMAA